jgi:hypothetical protein
MGAEKRDLLTFIPPLGSDCTVGIGLHPGASLRPHFAGCVRVALVFMRWHRPRGEQLGSSASLQLEWLEHNEDPHMLHEKLFPGVVLLVVWCVGSGRREAGHRQSDTGRCSTKALRIGMGM